MVSQLPIQQFFLEEKRLINEIQFRFSSNASILFIVRLLAFYSSFSIPKSAKNGWFQSGL